MWDKDKRQLLEEIRVLRSRNTKLERINSEMPGPRDMRLKPHADQGESIGIIASGRNITEHRQAQEELENSIEQFRMVMDSVDALVYVSDMDTYEILFTNKYGRDIWGDIVGKTCWKTLHSGQTGPCEFCTNDKLLDSNGEPTGIHKWEFKNTADNQWYDCHDQAIQWIDGRLVRIEIATIMTERKRIQEALEESERFNRTIVSSVGEGVIVYDRELRYLVWNRFMEELTGMPAEEVVGKPALELFPHLCEQGIDKLLQRALGGGKRSIHLIHPTQSLESEGEAGLLAPTVLMWPQMERLLGL